MIEHFDSLSLSLKEVYLNIYFLKNRTHFLYILICTGINILI